MARKACKPNLGGSNYSQSCFAMLNFHNLNIYIITRKKTITILHYPLILFTWGCELLVKNGKEGAKHKNQVEAEAQKSKPVAFCNSSLKLSPDKITLKRKRFTRQTVWWPLLTEIWTPPPPPPPPLFLSLPPPPPSNRWSNSKRYHQ